MGRWGSTSAPSIDRSNPQSQSAGPRFGCWGLSAAKKTPEWRHRLAANTLSVEAIGDLRQSAKAMYAVYTHGWEGELVTQSAVISAQLNKSDEEQKWAVDA